MKIAAMSTDVFSHVKTEKVAPLAARRRNIIAMVTISICASAVQPTLSADAPTGGDPRTRAFVLSNVYLATPNEADVCADLSQGSPEIFLKSLPPEQQQQLGTPDKQYQLLGLMQSQLGFKWLQMVSRNAIDEDEKNRSGWPKLPIDFDPATVRIEDVRGQAGIPDGKGAIVFNHHILAYDSCTNPEDFPMLNKNLRPYDGKIAYGINLDGKSGGDKFTSPSGEKNVSNQLWRATGCMKHFREFGNPENANTTLVSVAAPTLIEITGIDNEHDDSDVTVAIYASNDPLQADNRGRALANASFAIDPRPELIARTRGRIVHGVLTTEPVDVRLRYKEQIIDNIRELRGTRIRATLKPDGSIEGGFYGYYTLDSYFDSVKQMSQLGANLSSLSCPAIYSAIHQYADGYPDPNTKRNTAISTAMNFVGVAAFAVHPADNTAVSSN